MLAGSNVASANTKVNLFFDRNGFLHTVSVEQKLNARRIGFLKCPETPIQWKINLQRSRV